MPSQSGYFYQTASLYIIDKALNERINKRINNINIDQARTITTPQFLKEPFRLNTGYRTTRGKDGYERNHLVKYIANMQKKRRVIATYSSHMKRRSSSKVSYHLSSSLVNTHNPIERVEQVTQLLPLVYQA